MKKKNYQTTAAAADLALPDAVAMGDLAETVREGLLAMAVRPDWRVTEVMMQDNVTAACAHDPERIAVRHGREDGAVTLGGGESRCAGPGYGRQTAPPR